jgi:dipeptidase E
LKHYKMQKEFYRWEYFLLVTQLYKNNLLSTINQVVKQGTPYLGTSAGSVICGLSMQNTNDMPIITLPVFKLWVLFLSILMPIILIPIQTKHMGETRDQNKRVSFFQHDSSIRSAQKVAGSRLRRNCHFERTLQARLLIKIKWLLK